MSDAHPLDNIADLLDEAIDKTFELKKELNELHEMQFESIRSLQRVRKFITTNGICKED